MHGRVFLICIRNAALGLFCSLPWLTEARADVIDSSAHGFTVRSSVAVARPPGEVYARFLEIGMWWDSLHTYSGDAHNLSLEGRANGCFCEKMEGGGSVRHAVVVFADPGKIIRLIGGLGPIQSMAATGTLTWSFTRTETGTKVEMAYAVGGYDPNGFRGLPPIVDAVLSVQMHRLKYYAETGNPVPPSPLR